MVWHWTESRSVLWCNGGLLVMWPLLRCRNGSIGCVVRSGTHGWANGGAEPQARWGLKQVVLVVGMLCDAGGVRWWSWRVNFGWKSWYPACAKHFYIYGQQLFIFHLLFLLYGGFVYEIANPNLLITLFVCQQSYLSQILSLVGK